MSNIYILEPPTSGKILMKTTVGDIDIELWTKEAPKTCRNFIQLCLEGYYNNLIFHRVIPDFIVQGGDPNGDGTGGESIYGEPFKDEFHQRLRFTRRGLLAMANAGKDDNGSQFFFTLGATPELQNKHTIFGKVTGDTIFNMIKLQEGLIENEKPEYPHKILKTVVLNNPFPDIEPRVKKVVSEKKQKKEKKVGVKNFKLLSFGDEAEEDEEESKRENEKLVAKGKSSHDVLDDPKLSAETELVESKPEDDEPDHQQQLENIKKKLKGSSKKPIPVKASIDDKDEDEWAYGDDIEETKKRKVEELRREIKNVKKEYQSNKLKAQNEVKEKSSKDEQKESTIQQYNDEHDKYRDIKKTLLKKGSEREQFTLNLLEKFKKKLRDAKEQEDAEKEESKPEVQEDKQWMNHEFHFEDDTPVLAKDANTKDDDWFEIYDPRNPLNKRRRGETTIKNKK
ncbi:spliceosome-associated protein CWC27 homolog [Coccinella septempunctata]|uniref:spliceosome-associated protein CWC27 homolog n=1 Tax=Coccinella septempunctata TaxID=41139 RepID=UPI001D079E03|nr:spliceosome-associated protein CWC27 homolog [Coccinella septempunctata]